REVARGAGFTNEAAAQLGVLVGGQAGLDTNGLDGDIAADSGIVRLINDPHAAAAQLANQPIPADAFPIHPQGLYAQPPLLSTSCFRRSALWTANPAWS